LVGRYTVWLRVNVRPFRVNGDQKFLTSDEAADLVDVAPIINRSKKQKSKNFESVLYLALRRYPHCLWRGRTRRPRPRCNGSILF
jgi:hypothetical protein